MTDTFRIEKLEAELPSSLTANTLYFIKKEDNTLEIYLSTKDGSQAYPLNARPSNPVEMFKYQKVSPSKVWAIPHNRGTQTVICEIYNNDGYGPEKILPHSVKLASTNVVIVTFNEPVAGVAVLCLGDCYVPGGRYIDKPAVISPNAGYITEDQFSFTVRGPENSTIHMYKDGQYYTSAACDEYGTAVIAQYKASYLMEVCVTFQAEVDGFFSDLSNELYYTMIG